MEKYGKTWTKEFASEDKETALRYAQHRPTRDHASALMLREGNEWVVWTRPKEIEGGFVADHVRVRNKRSDKDETFIYHDDRV